MSLRQLTEIYEIWWMFESHHQQRLSWGDAAEARIARDRAEERARIQHEAMMAANPSGALGSSCLNDEDSLDGSGLL